MSQSLYDHLNRFIEVGEADRATILSFFRTLRPGKKELLLSAGALCSSHFFVEKGCLRMFFINERGGEQTVQFAIENWWITDYLAFGTQQKTEFYIQAIETSHVLCLDFHKQEALLERFPQMEKYFRSIYQIAAGASQRRIKYLYDFSKEEMYRHFQEQFPEFVQRIPQYLLASFLGLTPEYLSEIRSKPRS